LSGQRPLLNFVFFGTQIAESKILSAGTLKEVPMNCKNEQDVLRVVEERGVSFIQFWFTDVLGNLKSFAVTPTELEEGLTEGMGFDGSSIEGFARIQESDMIAKADPTTFQLIPWRGGDRPLLSTE